MNRRQYPCGVDHCHFRRVQAQRCINRRKLELLRCENKENSYKYDSTKDISLDFGPDALPGDENSSCSSVDERF